MNTFMGPRVLTPLPVYFPYYVTPFKRIWGRRITTLPTWALIRALNHKDLTLKQHAALRAAIKAAINFRLMAHDEQTGYMCCSTRGR